MKKSPGILIIAALSGVRWAGCGGSDSGDGKGKTSCDAITGGCGTVP